MRDRTQKRIMTTFKMTVNRFWTSCLIAAVVLLTLIGCGSNQSVYPVQGLVKFEGKPMVGGGSIALIPITSREGKTAGGEIKEDGTYTLMTYEEGDGSMIGDFRVVVTQVTVKEPPNTGDGQPAAQAIIEVRAADQIPAIYSDQQSSPLTAKVEAKPLNTLNFDLKRQ